MSTPKAQGRRVRRVLRKVDTWSVARMAFCLNLCTVVVLLTAGLVLWAGADGQGLIDKLEQTIRTNLQLEQFEIRGGVLFRSALLGGILLAGLWTALAVIAALLFNLLSDLVGGVQLWVLEEVIDPQPVYDQEAEPATGEQPTVDVTGGDPEAGTPAPQDGDPDVEAAGASPNGHQDQLSGAPTR